MLLLVLFGTPSIAAGASVTFSLIQGKTPAEAIKILAQEIDDFSERLTRVEAVQEQTQGEIEKLQENDQTIINQHATDTEALRASDQAIIEQQAAENATLQQKLEIQQAQISKQAQEQKSSERCSELEQAGGQFLPTKQPIKALYETLTAQYEVPFADAYAEYKQNGAKVLPEEEYRVDWEAGRANQAATLSKLKPYYDEFMANCAN